MILIVIKDCPILALAFDTPVDDSDGVDLGPLVQALQKAAPFLQPGVLLSVSSQIPAGTSRQFQSLLRELRPGLTFDYAYCPENLRLGEALACFLRPDRVVLGVDTPQAERRSRQLFAGAKADAGRPG